MNRTITFIIFLILPITILKSQNMNIYANEGFENVLKQIFFGIRLEKNLGLIDSFSNSKSLLLQVESPEYYTIGLTGKGGLRRVNYKLEVVDKKIIDFLIDSGNLFLSIGKYDKDESFNLLSFSFVFSFNSREDALIAYKRMYDTFCTASENTESDEKEDEISLRHAEFCNKNSNSFRFISISIFKPTKEIKGFSIAGSLK